MSFSEAFKVFELNLLRQSGVNVTAEQVGLKTDPIAALQSKNLTNSPFSMMLSRMGMTTPVAPTLPSDTTDTAAMKTYNQQLVAYNQNMQLYNQRFMQLMLSQMQQMQQTLATNKTSDSSSSASSTSASSSDGLGIGGILY